MTRRLAAFLFGFSLLMAAETTPTSGEKSDNFETERQAVMSRLSAGKLGKEEAEEKLNQINRREAAAKTEEAKLKVNSAEFAEAFKLLEDAILKDPENDRARKMHLALFDVLEVEKASVSSSEAPMTMRFLNDGKGLLGRKVEVKMRSGFKVVGIVVRNDEKTIIVYSSSANRAFEISKSDITVQNETAESEQNK